MGPGPIDGSSNLPGAIYWCIMKIEPEDPELQYCDIIDSKIRKDHPYFMYISEMRLAESSLGLAISQGSRLNETRLLLDMLDTLIENLSDPESVLSDPDRKMLNHADDVWLDLKDKMSQGDIRAAHLLAASSHVQIAVNYLMAAKSDEKFTEMVTDYQLKYLSKLSVHIYREAIGHVML